MHTNREKRRERERKEIVEKGKRKEKPMLRESRHKEVIYGKNGNGKNYQKTLEFTNR